MTQKRKYSIEEINQMRDSIKWSYPTGVSYHPKDRDADIENRLRTYMQNGTNPDELEKMAADFAAAEWKRHELKQEFYKQQSAIQPAPRVLRTAEDVIDEWFQTCVAQYSGAQTEAKELYDGFMGLTLKNFANNNAPDGVHITQKDMERYLDRKGIKSRRAMFAKRYDGIRHIIYGNVRSGNYGT